MQALTIEEICRAADGTLISGDPAAVINTITTDSRKASEGLFVPIAGEHFDGHDFITSAFDAGAQAAITHKDVSFPDKTVIRVADTFKALGDIAAYYKAKYNIPTVSITGSVGKTTTKDMIAGALSQKFNVVKTQGNFNNEIGVPLTVFTIESEHEAAVIELGMSGFGEIERLAGIVRPDIAVITNIGMSHIEKLGSREGIFKAKMEITSHFDGHNTLIVNGDDDYLKTVKPSDKYKLIKYGVDPANDVYAENIENLGVDGVRFTAVTPEGKFNVTVPVAGMHNVYNALAAICAGAALGECTEEAVKGIASFTPTAMRMAVENVEGITIINDCYNASPDSMHAAIDVLMSAEANRHIAVLGDILEMGDYAPDAHYEIGKYAAKAGIDAAICAGENAKHIARGAKDGGMSEVYTLKDADEAAEFTEEYVNPGDAVLIKASRGMHFEKIVEKLSGE